MSSTTLGKNENSFSYFALNTLSYLRELAKKPEAIESSPANTSWNSWFLSCSSQLQKCANSSIAKDPMSCFSVLPTCLNTFEWKSIEKGSQVGMEKTLETTKNMVLSFFQLCRLPEIQEIKPTQTLIDYSALIAIGAFTAIQPFATNAYFKEKTSIAKSINKGVITGTLTALLFQQNLYLGALAGAISASILDPLFTFAQTKTTYYISSLTEQKHIEETWIELCDQLKYFATIPIMGFFYYLSSHIPIPTEISYSPIILPGIIALSSGFALYLLNIPLTWVSGIAKTTKNLGTMLFSTPQIPLIAYSTLSFLAYDILQTPIGIISVAGLLKVISKISPQQTPSKTDHPPHSIDQANQNSQKTTTTHYSIKNPFDRPIPEHVINNKGLQQNTSSLDSTEEDDWFPGHS